MNEADREAYRQRYAGRLHLYGHDPRTLGWNKGKQRERFEALTQLLPLDRLRSVLDVGCGFGDLYPFLRARGFAGRYTGLDFVPGLVEVGRRAYPAADFVIADFSEYTPADGFDLVLASGAFNARLHGEDQWGYLTAVFTKMFRLCRVAACADFLTSYVDFRRDDLHYAEPEKILALVKGLTRRAALLHHYMPFEFAAYAFKDDRVAEATHFHPLAAECSAEGEASGGREPPVGPSTGGLHPPLPGVRTEQAPARGRHDR